MDPMWKSQGSIRVFILDPWFSAFEQRDADVVYSLTVVSQGSHVKFIQIHDMSCCGSVRCALMKEGSVIFVITSAAITREPVKSPVASLPLASSHELALDRSM